MNLGSAEASAIDIIDNILSDEANLVLQKSLAEAQSNFEKSRL